MRVSREQEAECLKLAMGIGPAPPGTMPQPKAGKYRNQRRTVDGIVFDSRKEAARWAELKARESAGRISWLRRQVRFPLVVNGITVCTYVADFVYLDGGVRIVEDVKSEFTRTLPVYRIKRKLMWVLHKVEIREV